MKMTVEIDERLLAKAEKLTKQKKNEVINDALSRLVRIEEVKNRVRKFEGKLVYTGGDE
jgi:hypothetical protein